MRISNITGENFKRRLKSNEKADFSAVLKQGREKVGNTGYSSLILPSSSLPQSLNTGVGNLLDKEALEFLDFAKQYWGINHLQLLPEGEFKFKKNGEIKPYSGSTFALGTHLINMEYLTRDEYGSLLTQKDLESIINSNKIATVNNRINYENVLIKTSPNERMLRKAFEELIKADTSQKKEVINEIKLYAEQNKEWLEPKALFEALSAKYQTSNTNCWNEIEKNLYNTDLVTLDKREQVIKDIRNSNLNKEAFYTEFKQFLAEKHLAKAKQEINNKGIKLSGDMLAGFTKIEIWANPKAFIKDSSIGWGLPAINFETPDGEKLLRQKANVFAKRYDGFRIDASWAYISQPVQNSATNTLTKREYGDKILKIIEDEVLKVKGKNFNLDSIMHEFIADKEKYSMFAGNQLKPEVQNRLKIITSSHLSSDWGSADIFKKRNWVEGSYILGPTNHDSRPLRVLYDNIKERNQQIEILSEILKIPKEKFKTFSDFMQAKFAEPMRTKHNMFFFTEALNIPERYKDNRLSSEDYRLKIANDYKLKYFNSLEKGEGLNVMDALEKAFVAEGLDKTEPELYRKIVKYKKILQTPENKKLKIYGLLTGLGLGVLLISTAIYLQNKKAGNTGSHAR